MSKRVIYPLLGLLLGLGVLFTTPTAKADTYMPLDQLAQLVDTDWRINLNLSPYGYGYYNYGYGYYDYPRYYYGYRPYSYRYYEPVYPYRYYHRYHDNDRNWRHKDWGRHHRGHRDWDRHDGGHRRHR